MPKHKPHIEIKRDGGKNHWILRSLNGVEMCGDIGDGFDSSEECRASIVAALAAAINLLGVFPHADNAYVDNILTNTHGAIEFAKPDPQSKKDA